MHALPLTLGLLGLACLPIGLALDYSEWRYGWPPRLPLRWEFIFVFAAAVLVSTSLVIALIDHDPG
jgi:hypothetical protein